MKKLNLFSVRYIIIIILIQVILLLVIFAGKVFGFFDTVYFIKAVNLILIAVFILAIIALYLVKDLFKLINQKMKIEIQKAKLYEKEKMINELKSYKHDFSNHLQMIYSLLQLNKHEKIKEYISSLDEDLEKINCANNKVVNSILDPVLISKKKEALEQGIQLDYEFEQGIKNIEGLSLSEISRILFNLIDNAINAINDFDRGGAIRIIGKNKTEGYIISVCNTGSYIEDDYLDQVFKLGVSTNGPDRGFGLYIIKSLIEDAGGSLEVKSDSQKYITEFVCYFIKE